MNPRTVSGVGLAIVACLWAPGCSPASYAAAADREVDVLLHDRTDEILGDRESWVVPTEEAREPAEGEDVPGDPDAPAARDPERPTEKQEEPPLQLGLTEALHTAVQHNREYQGRREGLYLQGLAVTRARFDFGPQLALALTPTYFDSGDGGSSDTNVLANFAASQILPTGGTLSATSSGFGDDWGKSFGLTLTQPLLRNAGYDVSHEALTQTERNLVYEIRSFELFRQDFSIRVAQSFFDLVSQKRTVGNEEANYRQAVFDRDKAEALFRVDRNDEQDIFRARRREIEANDTLIDARARYRRALDDFKILMGLPTSTEAEIVDQDPPFEPVRIDLASAVRAARHNRLDLMTQRDLVEDARRSVRISKNQLLPDVDVNLTGGYDDVLGVKDDGVWSVGASVTVEVPLQRTPERNAHRSALIALDRAERQLSLELDQLELDIRDQLRQLLSLEQRIELQGEQILQQQRAVTVSEFRYEAGQLENRDLLEARQSLVDARNALIQLQADHFIRRLRLLRDLGLLFVDERGEWR